MRFVMQEKKPVNFKEACEYLGIKPATLYKWIHLRLIPHYKVHNRKIYFKADELEKFVFNRSNRVMSRAEVDVEANR